MTGSLRHSVARRLLSAVAVLLGLFFMHVMPGSVFDAVAHDASAGADAPSMRHVTAASSLAEARTLDATAVSGVGEPRVLKDEGQSDAGNHSGMGLMGLCLAFLTVVLLVLAACLRPWRLLGGDSWLSIPFRSLPVRCRAPDLFALGVLRC